ncbi:MAG: hypothetical protein P4L85_08265 [Paludisphaera borealis]|uniref:hypothetical protein n=1 Tax=Paludisphaera borealis TaxID=1387353 RepID=UPI002845E9D4|nr:hypothetical protein [Paludisphaera borealis]MDR3619330.1 hypothetical protein [Paludisphaera borealis]
MSHALADPDLSLPPAGPSEARARRAVKAAQASGRRRLVDPATCERDYSRAEMEFMLAMDAYKQRSGRMFPTWSEVLEVLRTLGYEKPA